MTRKRTPADWLDSELYVGPRPPLSVWEAYRVPLCALLVVLLGLVLVLLLGGRASSQPLVLSLFPGIGLLARAFEEEGFCVVRGPDVLWGGDVRRFHPPAGVFNGVIGGPPCQAFSPLVHLVRHASGGIGDRRQP